MTIDPARRLAQALGLDALGHAPQRIHVESITGELHAMMLDTKRTFDSLIEQYAPSDAARETIFANSYYQHLSNSLAGSREFMAMEKVYEMAEAATYDLLIVDTPPAQHALDFLEAPERLFDLFEGSFVNLLLQPYRVAGRIGFDLFRRSSDRLLKVFERITGYDVLADLSDFFLAFAGMSAGFKERSQRVLTMLRQANTSFLLICAPEPASLSQVDRFFARLSADGMPIGGVIINRVHQADAIADETSYSLTETDVVAIGAAPDRAARRHRPHESPALGVSGPADARRARPRRDRSNGLVARGGAGASSAAFRSRSAQPGRRRGGRRVPAARASDQHRNRGNVAFGYRKRGGANALRAGQQIQVADADNRIEAQPAHRDQPSSDRFRCRLYQCERRDRADRGRVSNLSDDAHSCDVLRLSRRRFEVDAERTLSPTDQYRVCAVRQIELQAAGVLRLTRVVGGYRNR